MTADGPWRMYGADRDGRQWSGRPGVPSVGGMNTKLRAVLPMLLDVTIPVAGYYVLSACGLDDFWALTIAGVATAVNAVVGTLRRRRLDALGMLVVLEIALSIALFFVTGIPGSCC